MPSSFQWMLLGTLAVAMVTAAPVANQEELVDVKQGAESVDRAKRADEEIVFGNQQNKARVISKKSDLSNILTSSEPQGELDQGSEVIVHPQRPMDEEMLARVEAAEGGDKEKMDQAVEAAMETVANTEAGEAGQGETAEEDVAKQLVAAEVEDEAGNVSQVAEEEEEEEDEEDEDLKDLQEVVGAVPASTEGGDEGNAAAATSNAEDDVDELLQNLEKEGESEEEEEEEEEKDKELAEYYQKMYQYMMMPYMTGKNFMQGVPYYYYRRRRSLAASKNTASNGNNKRARRIKRDLLDDTSYDPYDIYNVPYLPEEVYEPAVAPADDYVSLTDDEAEYLYRRLLNYLSNSYVEEPENPYQEVAEVDPYLEAYMEPQEEAYSPYDIYNEETIPVVASPYDEGYPYGPVDLDTYQSYAKRGMVDYYPREEDKRYFFPFSEEPQTHWGAFVPEKRGDYEEAIQRLQRLAMALSDNPGPYYREMLEDYRRK